MRRILGTGARTGHPPHQGVSGRTGSSVSPPPSRMIVPESGIYECDCGQSHEYSTDVKGHRFPPLQDGCTGSGWKLKTAMHPSA